MQSTETKPAHRRFRLNPPHGDRIYWVADGNVPGDSRTEHVSADRAWFWRSTINHADGSAT